MNTLIINGHPGKNSYSSALALAYERGCKTKNRPVETIHLYELSFDLNLSQGYNHTNLEPDLVRAQELIKWAHKIVFVYPTWWWSMPALLKGFIDRVFVPGFAFKYEGNASLPKKLLKNKTATLLVTMDSPQWYYYWWMNSVGNMMMKKGILAFCGIDKTTIITFDRFKKRSLEKKKEWLEKVEKMV